MKDGRYETASPPFAGVAGEGSYSFLSTQGSCISYVTIRYQLEFHLLVVPSGLPFVFPVTTAETMTLPAFCDSTMNIEVLDPDTDQIIRQITEHAPASRDEIADSSQIATTDRTPPRVIGSNNLTTYRADQVELRFSEPMDADSVIGAFVVEDGDGTRIDGTVEVREGLTLGVFRPAAPFRLGEQYLRRHFWSNRSGRKLSRGAADHLHALRATIVEPFEHQSSIQNCAGEVHGRGWMFHERH